MAKFKSPAEFINTNVDLLSQRQSSMYSVFLESKPTPTTYYHVNKIRSRTDKGLKMPERLNGVMSPIRYNKLINFPLYGIEQIQLQLDENEEGLNSDYNGEAIILPNTIHPSVDDYFLINYLEKRYMFRVVKYEYDTIKSNNYYKIQFCLHAVDDGFYNDIERQVVKVFYTQFDNIGTDDKVFLSEDEANTIDKIKHLYDDIASSYLDDYYEPSKEPYNTLLFHRISFYYNSDFDMIFDQNLVHFCNSNLLFYRHDTTDAIYFYEEPRNYFKMDYAKSIYDLMEHYEPKRISKINTFFDLEPTVAMDSIFMYYRDKRVKYLRTYKSNINYYNKPLERYLPEEFINGIINSDLSDLTDPIDLYVATWIKDREDVDTLLSILDNIEPHHHAYTLHNYIFIPLLLFALFDTVNTLSNKLSVEENSIADELATEGYANNT